MNIEARLINLCVGTRVWGLIPYLILIASFRVYTCFFENRNVRDACMLKVENGIKNIIYRNTIIWYISWYRNKVYLIYWMDLNV